MNTKLKYGILTAFNFIALLIITIIFINSKYPKYQQNDFELLLRVQEITTTPEISNDQVPMTSVQTSEIFLGCFNASTDTSYLALLGSCQLMRADGHCDDLCNYPEMNFDDGDCCLDTIDNTYCVDCFCYPDCSKHPLHPGN